MFLNSIAFVLAIQWIMLPVQKIAWQMYSVCNYNSNSDPNQPLGLRRIAY